MKHYTKIDEVKKLLMAGWEIFTERGSGPNRTLYFHIYPLKGYGRKAVHSSAIESLIKSGFITGTDVKHGKYKLIKK